jgi:Cu/Ag efflux protein CusF
MESIVMTLRILLAAAAGLAFAASASAQEGTAVHINGAIEKVDGRTVTVKDKDGQTIAFDVAPKGRIVSNRKIDIKDIKAGEYIAIDTVEKNGKPTVVQAHTQDFAHGAAADNQRPMTTLKGGTRSLGQVAFVTPVKDGVDVKVTGAKGGEMDFTLTPGIVHYKNEVDAMTDLKPNLHVITAANRSADGRLTAGFVTVEKNGAMPVDIGY